MIYLIGPQNLREGGNYFPDSCCYDYETDKADANCSEKFPNSKSINPVDLIGRIYMRGCMDILKNLYQASYEMAFSQPHTKAYPT